MFVILNMLIFKINIKINGFMGFYISQNLSNQCFKYVQFIMFNCLSIELFRKYFGNPKE